MMEHDQLIERGYNWLKNTIQCRVILREFSSYAIENPDLIGWKGRQCYLVECKTSIADFNADKKKGARRVLPSQALGHYRFYLTPEGLLKNQELPDGWGWFYVKGKQIRHGGGSHYKESAYFKSNRAQEVVILTSALSRVQMADFDKLTFEDIKKAKREKNEN